MYDLDFYQALKECLENKKYIRGEQFHDGYFMKINSYRELVLVDTNNTLYEETPYTLIGTLYDQKYRIVDFLTKKELSK